MPGIYAAASVVFLIWAGWLVVGRRLLGAKGPDVLLTACGVVGLGLTLVAHIPWTLYLTICLAIAIPPDVVRAVVERQARYVYAASVSLTGIAWLPLFHATQSLQYLLGALFMILSSVAVVAAERHGWRALMRAVDRRTEEIAQEAEGRISDVVESARKRETGLKVSLVRSKEDSKQLADELRRAQAELKRTQAELKRARAQLEWVRKHPLIIRDIPYVTPLAEKAPPQPEPAEDLPPKADELNFVLINVAVEPLAPTGASHSHPMIAPTSKNTRGQASLSDQAVRLVIERYHVPVSPLPGRTDSELAERARDFLRDELSHAAASSPAEKIADLVVPSGRLEAATQVDTFALDIHNLLLGQPVEKLGSWAGMPQPAPAALGSATTALPIPILDTAATTVKRTIEICAVVWGAMTGNPVLVAAAMKSIAHDELTRVLEMAIEKTVISPLTGKPEEVAEDPVDAVSDNKAISSAIAFQQALQKAHAISDWPGIGACAPEYEPASPPYTLKTAITPLSAL